MEHSPEKLRERTRQFALRILALARALRSTLEARTIADQLLRSGMAVAANYRSACRSRSRAEFVSRMAVVVEEADESVFWLEMLADGAILPHARLAPLIDEARQILRIMSASRSTAARTRDVKSQITNR